MRCWLWPQACSRPPTGKRCEPTDLTQQSTSRERRAWPSLRHPLHGWFATRLPLPHSLALRHSTQQSNLPGAHSHASGKIHQEPSSRSPTTGCTKSGTSAVTWRMRNCLPSAALEFCRALSQQMRKHLLGRAGLPQLDNQPSNCARSGRHRAGSSPP